MELDVTRVIRDYDMWDFAHSESEGGPSAGRDTWRAALEAAGELRLVTTANADEVRSYFADFGAWSDRELEAMSNRELSALLLQFIAGDYREQEKIAEEAQARGQSGAKAVEQAMEEGQISGNLTSSRVKGRTRWYYYVGH